MLDPDKPAVCFVYSGGISSQWNQFEADTVSSIIFLLHGRLASRLRNEKNPKTGEIVEVSDPIAYTDLEFWNKGIGIVTPHRAQQGKIVSCLQDNLRILEWDRRKFLMRFEMQ